MPAIARVLLPVLALLVASSASAQDMPDLVQVTVNLTFVLPTQPGPVNLTGTWLYQNSGPSPGGRWGSARRRLLGLGGWLREGAGRFLAPERRAITRNLGE